MAFICMITALYALAVFSPGPDFMMVCRNAITYSRRAAVITALGVTAGVALHVTYSLFALKYLSSQNQYWLAMIKYIGATYLLYLGASSLIADNTKIALEASGYTKQLSIFEALSNGFLCNVLNPKAVLFFISIFTFLNATHITLLERLSFGIEVVVLTFLWLGSVAYFITVPSILNKIQLYQSTIMRIFSLCLIMISLYLFLH